MTGGEGRPYPGVKIGNEIAQLSVWEMIAALVIAAPILAGLSGPNRSHS